MGPDKFHIFKIASSCSFCILAFFLFLIYYPCPGIKLVHYALVQTLTGHPPRQIVNKTYAYVVNNNGCKILDLDPLDPEVQKLIFEPKGLKCSGSLFTLQNNFLKINPEFPLNSIDLNNTKCCYRAIKRITEDFSAYDTKADSLISISQKCKQIFVHENSSDLRIEDEFIKIECTTLPPQLFAPVLHPNNHSESTKRKAKSWDSKLEHSKPPNVLIIGLDSVSRLNMYRQLPHTRKTLASNGFVELKGYNRIGLNTFPNMMGLLGGMFKNCPCFTSSYPNDSFDNCPFVFKNFSDIGYMTGFLEDAPNMAIFNYLKTGFVNPPADYYLRPIFLAANGPSPCFGSMNPTQFMSNYIMNFVAAMKKDYPYFLFSWFTSAGHGELNDVHAEDKVFSQLLQIVANESNTVIFFISDHGIRYGTIRETFNGYYEESLPFFFIRLPSTLKKKFPDWQQNLESNQNKLTTPLDVYGTLCHILHDHPRPAIERTYSLFEKIPSTRTCRTAHIPEQFCRCGQIPETNSTPKNSIYMANFLVSVVNNYVKHLIQSNTCHFLVLSKVLHARKFIPTNDGDEYRKYIVVFQVVPGDGKFEGQVKVHRNKTMEAIGSVYRIDSYISTSDCINDWAYKNYCMCQNQVKMPF